jgi:hypothetical protein
MTRSNPSQHVGEVEAVQPRWSGIAMASALIIGIPTFFYVMDIAQDRRYIIRVMETTPLLTLPPHEYPSRNPPGFVVNAGERLKVLRVRYGKDFEALQVETATGEIGWALNGVGIEVVSRGVQK